MATIATDYRQWLSEERWLKSIEADASRAATLGEQSVDAFELRDPKLAVFHAEEAVKIEALHRKPESWNLFLDTLIKTI